MSHTTRVAAVLPLRVRVPNPIGALHLKILLLNVMIKKVIVFAGILDGVIQR